MGTADRWESSVTAFDALGLLRGDAEPVNAPALFAAYIANAGNIVRFREGEPVPSWLKRPEPPAPEISIVFARDCEVLRHDAGATIWPMVPFKRLEPRFFINAKDLPAGTDLVGQVEFFSTPRS